MDSTEIFFYIKKFYDWLSVDTNKLHKFKLPNECNWQNLDEPIKEIPTKCSGFYIIRKTIELTYKKPNPILDEYFKKTDIIYIGESSKNLKNSISALKTSIRKSNKTKPHAGGVTISKFSVNKTHFEIYIIKTGDGEKHMEFGGYLAKLFERYLVLTFFIVNSEKPIANKE